MIVRTKPPVCIMDIFSPCRAMTPNITDEISACSYEFWSLPSRPHNCQSIQCSAHHLPNSLQTWVAAVSFRQAGLCSQCLSFTRALKATNKSSGPDRCRARTRLEISLTLLGLRCSQPHLLPDYSLIPYTFN